MQRLTTPEEIKEYPEALPELEKKFPGADFSGKPFEIESDFKREIVQLKIDGVPYYLTRRQALDLGNALIREAKRVVKKQRKAMGR